MSFCGAAGLAPEGATVVAVAPAAGAAAGAAGAPLGLITGTGAAWEIVNKGSVMPAERVFDTPRQFFLQRCGRSAGRLNPPPS